MARDIDPFKLSSPRIYLFRMLVFLVLGGLVIIVLYRQIWEAFRANPGLNALIVGVLLIGIALSFRQVIRLYPEINWVNGFRLADPGLALRRALRQPGREELRPDAYASARPQQPPPGGHPGGDP